MQVLVYTLVYVDICTCVDVSFMAGNCFRKVRERMEVTFQLLVSCLKHVVKVVLLTDIMVECCKYQQYSLAHLTRAITPVYVRINYT